MVKRHRGIPLKQVVTLFVNTMSSLSVQVIAIVIFDISPKIPLLSLKNFLKNFSLKNRPAIFLFALWLDLDIFIVPQLELYGILKFNEVKSALKGRGL
jgi:hypothetical protein